MNKMFARIVIACALAWACEYKDTNPCYRGRVVWSSCCTGSTFISIQSFAAIGKDITINGQSYSNVIQLPGYITGPDVYLNLRKYDPQKDISLFPIHCYCLIAAGMEAPLYVATAVSTTSCPNQTSQH